MGMHFDPKQRGLKALALSDLTAPNFPVPGLLPEGLILFGGRPKVGKTWTALNIATSAALGEAVFGRFPCQPLNVVYFDLENGDRLIKARMETLFPSAEQMPDRLNHVSLYSELRPLSRRHGVGAIEDLEEMLDAHADAGMPVDVIFIDTLKSVVSGKARGQASEHQELLPLHELAIRRGVSIVGIEHLTKRTSWKELSEAFGGTNGQTGAAGEFMVLDDRDGSLILRTDGRLTPRQAITLELVEGRLVAAGEAEVVVTAKGEKLVLEYLASVEGARSLEEIKFGTGLNYDAAKKATYRLRDRGLVLAEGRGKFRKGTSGRVVPPANPVPLSQLQGAVPSVPLVPNEENTKDIKEVSNTSLTVQDIENTTKGDNGTKGTTDSERDKGTVEGQGTDISDEARRFLVWLANNRAVGETVIHRDAQQRMAPALSGEAIRTAAPVLAEAGYVDIAEHTEDGLPNAYVLTPIGREFIKGPSLFG